MTYREIDQRRLLMRGEKGKFFLAITAISIFGLIHFGSVDIAVASPEGVLKEAIHWGISADFLDPATGGYAVSGHLPLYLFHDALLKPMAEGLYTPCLAESWTISPDFKIYEFKLRKGVKFHNGDIMSAEDVVFSFWRYRASQAKMIHDRTEKVEAVNPNLVRIRFKEAFPDFLEYLLPGVSTIGWVVPKRYVEKVGDAGYKKNPVGCGPYKFIEFRPGVRIVGEAFEEFWRKVPHVKRMEFYWVPEAATRLAMVRRGEVDIATYMADVFYHDVKRDPKLRMLAPLSPNQLMVYIPSQWDAKSPWADPRIRKAASLALDRQSLADVHLPGCGPIGSLGFKDDPLAVHFPADPYDPAQAKKLMAEAGYPKGFHGGKFWPYDGTFWPLGEQVANYWKAIGINVETLLLDRPSHIANVEGGKMKGGIFTEVSGAPTITGRLSHLFGRTSYGNYPDIQDLWDQYRRALEPNARKDLITRIQVLIHERTVWIPLISVNSPRAVNARVKGNPYKVQPYIWFTAPFEDVELVK
jgi:peptide/nickel transport system substrate-binding protein